MKPAGPGRAARRGPLLPSSVIQSLRALLVMVQEPLQWQSVRSLAEAEALPEARLEQLLLKLRRAGVLEARRGRHGGYRLAQAPAALPVAVILKALEAAPPRALLQVEPERPLQESAASDPATAMASGDHPAAAASIPIALGAEVSVAADPHPQVHQAAAAQVTAALLARLQRALERELAACTLEDLHHDLRSTQALLSDEGGLLLG